IWTLAVRHRRDRLTAKARTKTKNERKTVRLFKSMFLGVLSLLLAQGALAAEEKFTPWGWPQPYEKISDKSVAWLKEKGWWPLTIGWQGPWSGENTTNVVMSKVDFLTKRGIESKFQVFAAGPDVNEAVAAGRIQIGNGGNFPFTSLLD